MNKKMVEVDMEIATLKKRETVIRVGQKQYNSQSKQKYRNIDMPEIQIFC